MRAPETEDRLRELLEAAAVPLVRDGGGAWAGDGAGAQDAWEAFRTVAATPAGDPVPGRRVDPDRDGDLLLFESSVGERRPEKGWRSGAEPPEPAAYQLNFTRQFTFEDDEGEYAGMAGLFLTIEFELTGELDALARAQLWGGGGPDRAAAWIAEVEATPAFATAWSVGRLHAFHFEFSNY